MNEIVKASIPFRYHFLSYRREQLLLPIALWCLFVFIVTLMRGESRSSEMGAAYLAMVLPMMGGMLASAALVGDPTLELQFATKRPSWRSLLERLGLLFGVLFVAAMLFQAYLLILGVDLSLMGNPFSRQIAWIVSTLAVMALSTVLSLIAVNATIGVMAVGGIWVFQLLLHGFFETSPWARYLYWFAGSRMPNSPDLPLIQLCMIGTAVVFLLVSVLLLRRQERYI